MLDLKGGDEWAEKGTEKYIISPVTNRPQIWSRRYIYGWCCVMNCFY